MNERMNEAVGGEEVALTADAKRSLRSLCTAGPALSTPRRPKGGPFLRAHLGLLTPELLCAGALGPRPGSPSPIGPVHHDQGSPSPLQLFLW